MSRFRIDFNVPQAKTFERIRRVWDRGEGIEVGLPWGRGVGKTLFMLQCMLLLVALWERRPRLTCPNKMRGVRIVLMCPTFKQAKDLYANKLEEELGPGGRFAFLRAKIDHTTWQIKFKGGSTIQLFGAVAWQSALGQRVDAVFIDECDGVSPEVIDTLVGPWFSEPWSIKIRVLGGTPRRGRKGSLYRVYARANRFVLHEDGTPYEGYYAVHATGYDTPGNVSLARLEYERRNTDPSYYKREWLCDFDSAEHLVYAFFMQGFHVATPHPDTRFHEHIGGIDWGFQNPSAVVVAGVFGHGLDAGIHVRDEFYQRGVSDGDLADKVLALQDRYGVSHWYGDPSKPGTIQYFRKRGVRIFAADNDREPGIQFVQNKMVVRYDETSQTESSKFYVHPKCRAVIEEMGEYRRKVDARDPTIVLDEAVKKNDHAMDALRYMAFTHLGSPDGSGRRTTA